MYLEPYQPTSLVQYTENGAQGTHAGHAHLYRKEQALRAYDEIRSTTTGHACQASAHPKCWLIVQGRMSS